MIQPWWSMKSCKRKSTLYCVDKKMEFWVDLITLAQSAIIVSAAALGDVYKHWIVIYDRLISIPANSDRMEMAIFYQNYQPDYFQVDSRTW